MHLLLIHQAFASSRDAGGTRHFELARHMVRNGHGVTVVTSQVSYLTGKDEAAAGRRGMVVKERVEGVDVWRVRPFGALHRTFVTRVINFASFMLAATVAAWRVPGVDLVMGTSPPIFQGLSALVVARLKRVPLVFEVRDLWPDFAVEMGVLRNRLLIAGARWLERFLYRQARLLVVNSPAYVVHIAAKGVPESDIAFVPNGVDVAMFDPAADGAHIRRQLGLEGKVVALYAGAHGQANDLTTLLEAAQRIQAQGRGEVAFVLVGDGREKPNLIACARELGLTNVHFVDAQPKARMPEFLAAADVCVAILQNIPMFTTTYPNKVFDYMAAGRPVVLAIDGVIRQVVEEGGAGVFVPPGDPAALAEAVLRLASDPEGCARMGASGRRYVEQHFDRAQQAQQFQGLMTGVAGHGPGRQEAA